MKRCAVLALALGLLAAMAIQAFAETRLDDYAYYDASGALQHDFPAYYHALALDLVQHSGVDVDPESYWYTSPIDGARLYDYDAFRASYDRAVEALQKDVIPLESADSTAALPGVLESSGTLDEPAQAAAEAAASAPDAAVYDLRGDFVEGDRAPDTFKAVVSRIFGEYTPVTSARTVTGTVDGEPATMIIDVVAPGAAGIDFVWLTGAALFAIMLFCLFRLLGGIIS